jgi:hypothetical protein
MSVISLAAAIEANTKLRLAASRQQAPQLLPSKQNIAGYVIKERG